MECVRVDPSSPHFLFRGQYISFGDWRFIHRARLNQPPLNAARPWIHDAASHLCQKRSASGGEDTEETLPHVLKHCMAYSSSYMHRHNTLLRRLISTTEASRWTVYSCNTAVGSTRIRPDLITITQGDVAMIIDATCALTTGLPPFFKLEN